MSSSIRVFLFFSVSKAGMVVKHYDGYGTLLYTAAPIPPRGAPPAPPAPPVPTTTPLPAGTCADEASWPDLDHDLICGECKVLVNHFDSNYGTCDAYCQNIGRSCLKAWEEMDDTCAVFFGLSCNEPFESSDAICQCSGDITDAVV